MSRIALIVLLLVKAGYGQTQPMRGDSWQTVKEQKTGTVTALWDEIEPFIYTDENAQLKGVEYEIMESFRSYLKTTYGVELTVQWQKAGSFDSIYYKIKTGRQPGLFGWSYYSITPERSKEVSFSLPYMPDLNVLITNNREPMYASAQEFTSRLREMSAYTQANTTMQEDVNALKQNFQPTLPVTILAQDYDIIQRVEQDEHGFGYVPLSIYIVALQRGHKVKRQSILASKREGFAAVMPPASDWKPVIDEYFSSAVFRNKAGAIVAKYLGSKVKDLVFIPSIAEAEEDSTAGMELVSLEKEIVTKRLMDTAVEAQRHKSYQNVTLIIAAALLTIMIVLYGRYRTKRRLNKQLETQNREIVDQRDKIDSMNQLLQLKILQSRLNPHFLFNSLNSIQYFVMGDDKKATLTYISRFSSFLRKVIHHGDEIHISAADEKEVLAEYLWLEQTRFRDKFEYSISVSGNIRSHRVLPLLSVSIVENILYQNILPFTATAGNKLSISFESGDEILLISICHNVSERTGNNNEKINSFVDNNADSITQRISLFNGQAKEKIMLTHEESEETGIRKTVLKVPQASFILPVAENDTYLKTL
ncbi:MAG: histidine kinase [Chitinophagaceae bacterium]|nr:histidine kinase [Chitinophagaceae bacterium]